MKGIYLGLEALGTKSDAASLFNKTIAYYEAMEQFSDAVHEFSKLTAAYESVCSINACIKRYGVTQSLEALFGENFRSTASMEEETEAAKQGLGARIKAAIEKILKYLKELWTKFKNGIINAWTSFKKSKFVRAFTFKKKTGETVEVKNQNDLDRVYSEMDSNVKKAEAKYKEAEKALEDAKKKVYNSEADRDAALKPLQEKADAAKEELQTFTSSFNSLKAAKEAADKKKSAKMVEDAIKEVDYDVNESGLSGGESYR